MKALISPNENNRICQVDAQDFPVADPLFWADCPDNCTTEWTYNNGTFEPPVPPIATADENKTTASGLLTATDWTTIADVVDPINSPYLTNQAEFLAYRNTIRGIAVNPTAGNLTWPTQPTDTWSTV